MKICFVCGSFPNMRCGVGDYTAHLSVLLAQHGHRVTVITSRSHEVQPQAAVRVRPEITTWGVKGLVALLRAIDAEQPDVVHLQYPSLKYGRGLAPNLLLPLLRMMRPRIIGVLTLHEYAIFSWLGKLRLAPALAAARQVVCTNHLDRRAVSRFLLWRRLGHGLNVIPLGSNIDPGPLTPKRTPSAKARTRPPCYQLVYFGTVMPNKGWEHMIPAIAQLRGQGYPVELVAITELNPQRYAYHQQVLRLIQRSGLEAHIQFTGYLPAPQASTRLKTHAIALCPFRAGARLNRSSLVAVLTHGLAVVTTRPDFPLEGLRHGEHVWLVDPDNSRALAEGLRDLFRNPKQIMKLQAGARQAARRFDWGRIARCTAQVYRGGA